MGREEYEAISRNKFTGTFDKKKTNVTLVNNVAKDEDFTVPTGQEWTVLRGRMHNGDDAARNASVICYDSAGIEMATLHTSAALAAAANIQFPRLNQNAAEDPMRQPMVLEAGDYVRFHWDAGGASAGGTSVVMLHILKRQVT